MVAVVERTASFSQSQTHAPHGRERAHLEIRLLGGPEVRVGQALAHFETTKTLALLAYLIMRPGPHRREALAKLLWPTLEPGRASRNLRRALWNLRQALQSPESEASAVYLSVTRQEVAFWRQGSLWLDVEAFERAMECAMALRKRQSPERDDEALQSLHAGLALFRGEFMEGVTMDDAPEFDLWLMGQRAYHQELALQGLQLLSELQIQRGDCQQAVLTLRRLLMLSPWSEWAHRQLMFCYALTGRRSEALAQYHRCRQALNELQATPLTETTELYLRIRDPNQYHRLVQEGVFAEEGASQPKTFPFIGRGREHAKLLDLWRQRSGITLIAGEAGVGKTRLAEEALRHLAARGVLVLKTRCYQFGRGASFQPIADALRHYLRMRDPERERLAKLDALWLSELSRLIPEIQPMFSLPPAHPVAEQDRNARGRLFEAVARFFESLGADVAFFLDDLHWADPDTLDLLRFLTVRLARAPIWWVASYRPEDAARGSPLWVWRRELESEGKLDTLTLAPFSLEGTRRLVASLQGLDDSTQALLSEVLHEESHGNALILVERLRDWMDRGVLFRQGEQWRMDRDYVTQLASRRARGVSSREEGVGLPAPQRVHSMIMGRVERLSADSQRWLEFAAAVGASFTTALLADAAHAPLADVEAAIDDWLRRGLVQIDREQDHLAYDFSHSLVRQVVYESIPPPSRQRMHARVAMALARQSPSPIPAPTAEALAYHYGRSGNRRLAVQWLMKAGELMQARHAQEAAIDLFTQALSLMRDDEPVWRFQALAQRERAYNQLARRREQAADLETMMALARKLGDARRQADVLRRRAEWAMRVARLRQGVADAQQAFAWAEKEGAFELMARALYVEAMCHLRIGDFQQAAAQCEKGIRYCEKSGDPSLRALLLGVWGVADLDRGRLDSAREHMEEALAHWRRVQNLWREAILCNNLSMLYRDLGDLDRAMALQQRTRELIPQIGDVALDAHSLTSLGLLYFDKGQFDEALRSFDRALSLIPVIQDEAFEGYTRMCRGNVFLSMGRLQEALDAYQRAQARIIEVGASAYLPSIQIGLARCALAQHQPDQALAHLEAHADTFHQAIAEEQAGALLIKACALERLGRRQEAQQAWRAYHSQKPAMRQIPAWISDMEDALSPRLSQPPSPSHPPP